MVKGEGRPVNWDSRDQRVAFISAVRVLDAHAIEPFGKKKEKSVVEKSRLRRGAGLLRNRRREAPPVLAIYQPLLLCRSRCSSGVEQFTRNE